MSKVRQTKRPSLPEPKVEIARVKTTPDINLTEFEIRLTTRYSLENIDQRYKYNSVEVTVGATTAIFSDQAQAIAEFSQFVRAVFDEEMEAKIDREIQRIEGRE